MNAKFELNAGIIYRGIIRNFLERCKFDGLDFQWLETKSWFTSHFIIKGKEIDVRPIYNRIKQEFPEA